MAHNAATPAFIDPPDPVYGSLDEWLTYRAELQNLAHLPGIDDFVAEADEIIEGLLRANP